MSKKLWGGRFGKETDKDFFEFQKSIQYDHKLAKYDVIHSLIHVATLASAKILTTKEKNKLLNVLKGVIAEINAGKFKVDPQSEDIHTEIQNRVEKKLGKLALKLHTLRSRNDQIAFDEKSYCYDKARLIENLLGDLLKSVELVQNRYKKISMVGYTHTQRAQKIAFKDYLGAYHNMFERDKKRLSNFWKDVNIHIGAGALAGTPVRGYYEKAIKDFLKYGEYLIRPSENTIDDVSDRDFIIEFLSILSILQMHLSRLAEDLIIYSTKEFDFIKLPEEFCTGSSLMPHKKNPDFLELVRGNTGRVYGNLMAILATMKGLPLSYNRDMQLDKEPLFSSVETIGPELKIMAKFLKGIKLNISVINEALKDRKLYATDEAYRLVLNKKISFKEAHDIVGRSVKEQERLEKRIYA